MKQLFKMLSQPSERVLFLLSLISLASNQLKWNEMKWKKHTQGWKINKMKINIQKIKQTNSRNGGNISLFACLLCISQLKKYIYNNNNK